MKIYLPVDAGMWKILIPDLKSKECAFFVYSASLADRDQLDELAALIIDNINNKDQIYAKAIKWASKLPKRNVSILDHVRYFINGGRLKKLDLDINPYFDAVVKADIGKNGVLCAEMMKDTTECEDLVDKDPTLIEQIRDKLIIKYDENSH